MEFDILLLFVFNAACFYALARAIDRIEDKLR
jgi:hypothetical protein